MGIPTSLKQSAERIRRDIYALYLAYRNSKVPLRAKVLIAVLIGYAASPIDLIPDFIPVLGYLDDLILLPLGVSLAFKMIPKGILAECMEKVSKGSVEDRPNNWLAAMLIIALWLAVIVFVGRAIWRFVR